MDPDAALAAMREAYLKGDLERVAEYAVALDQWISNGGFLPKAWSNAR
jgi:hypothetical protein